MNTKSAVRSQQSAVTQARIPLRTTNYGLRTIRGFTLIETLVAISILTIAVVSPMALTAQALTTAYYARDQITAFYLAQEAIEDVRAVRDTQILIISQNPGGGDLFGSIPVENPGDNSHPFIIDSLQTDTTHAITECTSGACPFLRTDDTKTFYGYDPAWTTTRFTRTVHAQYVRNPDGTTNNDEIRVTVTVSWMSGKISRSFNLYENLYRWVNDGSATH
jgi:prepilin-type N-terminal cleavage/methylation domain-containing protein